MGKRFACLSAVFFISSCLVAGIAMAKDSAEEAKLRLRDIREKKAQLTFNYEENIRKTHGEFEDKMAIIKEDYRKARENCIEERNKKSRKLQEDYENELKPIIREEDQLLSNYPDEGSNFAKTRFEKEKSN